MQHQPHPTLVTVNQKGQLVIPKKIRDLLQINPQTPLYIQAQVGEIRISLHTPGYLAESKNQGLLRALEETRGAWESESKEELAREKKQRTVDLKATRKAKDEEW